MGMLYSVTVIPSPNTSKGFGIANCLIKAKAPDRNKNKFILLSSYNYQ